MKRLALIGFAVVMFMGLMPSANATVYGEKCSTFVGPGGNRAVQFCASMASDGTYWWGRAEGHDVAGYGGIDQATANLYYYSSNGTITCWGDVSAGAHSCEGQGTKAAFDLTPPNNGATNPHFGFTDHYCTSWSTLSVIWYYIHGGQQYSTTLSSWAVATPPCVG